MKLDNIYPVFRKSGNVVMPWHKGKFAMCGRVYGHSEYEDGSVIITSYVKSIENGIMVTESGTKYTLGSAHPDYLEIIEAIKSNIPVIHSYSLKGNHRDGYWIRGLVRNKLICRKIDAQSGHYIRVGGTICLVVWKNLVLTGSEKSTMEFCNSYLDLNSKCFS